MTTMTDLIVSIALIAITLVLLTVILSGALPLAVTVLAAGLASAAGLVILADRADAWLGA
jgi:hypothetical protein